MPDKSRSPAPPGKKVNDHKLTPKAPPAGQDLDVPPDLATDQETTRYLSAATQLNVEYARNVIKEVVGEKFRALAPTYGIDIPVVAMWAIRSMSIRARRDYLLAGLLTIIVACLALTPMSLWLLAIAALAAMAAWLVVAWEHWERVHNVVIRTMLRNRFKLANAPEPPRAADRERLAEIRRRRDGNLVVFSGPSAFVGCGKTVWSQRLLLDASRGPDDDNGQPTVPQPFSTRDLHAALIEAFDHGAGLGQSLQNIKVYERLFVNGQHIQNNHQLLPDPYRPPPTSVSQGLLDEATTHPSPEARTYVCVEMPGWQGQLVVTLFVRAVHAGGSLFVEWTFKVLPPLRQSFLMIDRFYDQSRAQQLKNSLGRGLCTMPGALLKSPYWAVKTSRAARVARNRALRQSGQIRRGFIFDYGARRSIRETASARGKQGEHYFLARDQAMYLLLAEKTLTRTVGAFLKDHGVSLAEFESQIKVIFDNSIKVGNIDGSGVVVGHQSSSTVNDSAKGQRDAKPG
ncbi:MAG TPA: hypothetical protein VGJ19_05700 [Streptosporangiaceae bacterium]